CCQRIEWQRVGFAETPGAAELKFLPPGKLSVVGVLLLAFCFAKSARAQDQPPPQGSTPSQQPNAPESPSPASDASPASPSSTQDPSAASAPTATTAPAQPTSFDVTGTVRAGKTPLPGVTVTAANTLTGKKYSVATASN